MKQIISTFFLSLIFFGNSYADKLVFSLKNSVEYNNLKTKNVFTLLESGKYSFETTSGGFHLCSGMPSGQFSGRVSSSKLKELINHFISLNETCKNLESCSTKKREKMSYDWSILGWGNYADKSYYLKSSSTRPKLLESVFELKDKLFQQTTLSLKIQKISYKKDILEMKVSYTGKGHLDFGVDTSNFVVLGKKKQRRLPSGHQSVVHIHSGHAKIIKLNLKGMDLEKGDYIVYSPQFKHELTPCLIL